MIRVIVDTKGVAQINQKLRQKYRHKLNEYNQWLLNMMKTTMFEIKNEFPKDTGKTVNSITLRTKPNGLQIISDSDVIMYIEHGTSAHGPVTANALKFDIGGKTIFAKWVQGIQPHNIIKRAVQRLEQRMEDAY